MTKYKRIPVKRPTLVLDRDLAAVTGGDEERGITSGKILSKAEAIGAK